MTVAYDGTDYAGWQIQIGQPTIQGRLERAIAKLTGQRIRITGSGRTDSGVHAVAQVASLTTDAWRAPAGALARAMNTKLPPDIAVLDCQEMRLGFHAIRDATGKRYRYQLQVGGVRDALQQRYRLHIPWQLETDLMRQAAERFVGEHDFASFQAAGGKTKTTVRHVRELRLREQQGRGGSRELDIEIEANGFLYNMVRNIVGTLLEVGRGKFPPPWVDEVFAARDRDRAGNTAPPQGLFLVNVDYPQELKLENEAVDSRTSTT
ncbi:MAG: tRNA pseudouridine(38-40) synthase TruA, partial [Pirellulaceae bacterium]